MTKVRRPSELGDEMLVRQLERRITDDARARALAAELKDRLQASELEKVVLAKRLDRLNKAASRIGSGLDRLDGQLGELEGVLRRWLDLPEPRPKLTLVLGGGEGG